MTRLAFLLIMAGVLSASASAGASSPRWTIHNLGTLPAPFNVDSYATAINVQRVVIGASDGRNGQQRAFVWRDGRIRELRGFGGWTQANAIAADGDIVGEGLNAQQRHHHAILWHHGKRIDLGTLGGRVSAAQALNDREQIVGDSTTTDSRAHAFLWEHGTMTDLGTLGGAQTHAVAINDNAQVIGTSTTASGAQHAFLWQQGTMTDLGSLSGEDSVPTAIDGRGDIVGYVHPRTHDPDHAVLWPRGNRLHDLGSFGSKIKQADAIDTAGRILISTLRPEMRTFLWESGRSTEVGRGYTEAHGSNKHGWVVGSARFRTNGPKLPFVWNGGTLTALPTLHRAGPPFSFAVGINDNGWITGSSYAVAGDRAVLWTYH